MKLFRVIVICGKGYALERSLDDNAEMKNVTDLVGHGEVVHFVRDLEELRGIYEKSDVEITVCTRLTKAGTDHA